MGRGAADRKAMLLALSQNEHKRRVATRKGGAALGTP